MKSSLERLLQRALDRAAEGGRLKLESRPPLLLEVPKDPRFGDLASTMALALAKQERQPPRRIAELIRECIEDPDGILAEPPSIEGPGFLNFRLSTRLWEQCLRELFAPGFARPDLGRGKRVLVEFVSANPTGPLHVGHGRGAVLGDVVARLLAATGHSVTREYYVNDAGKQVDTLGRSTLARLLQAYGRPAEIPEDGYPGEYLMEIATRHREELAAAVAEAVNERLPDVPHIPSFLDSVRDTAVIVCGTLAARWLLDVIRADLAALRVAFDTFVSERQLRADGAVERALAALDARGLIYEADGARWFRSQSFGDEKDRVVCRADGELTYFASDIAYHLQKLERGYDLLIDMWGADHHGYIPRVKASIQAMGRDPGTLRVLLVQMVRLTRGGEPVKMGKRSGEFVTMREVVDEVGADAARFFYLMRKSDSHLDFDLDLAKKQSSENPVFYVQYAHARICSLFRQAAEAGLQEPAPAEMSLRTATTAEELEVIKAVARFPDVVEEAARELEPHRLVFYLIELAGSFHRFYNRHRIVGSEPEVAATRLFVCRAVQKVLQRALDVLGIESPESM